MFSPDQAWQTILTHAQQLAAVNVPLSAALNRTLRTPICAETDAPPFDAAAMDGYALQQNSRSAPLRVIGTSQAGIAFAGSVGPGECVRIFTGAPVPSGADCVVKQEEVTRSGESVQITSAPGPHYIRRRGENCRAGAVLVAAGTRLGPPELAALAGAGCTQPSVTRIPRCVHLVTGNELVAPDQTPTGAQIRDSNSTLIAALLAGAGAELAGQARVTDDLTTARAVAEALPVHDILLISGGASVGDHDIARPLLESLGYTLHFHALNLRPGKPLVFATRGQQLAFALPGNPVSHWVVFQLFIAPLLRYLATGTATPPPQIKGRLQAIAGLPAVDARQTFWPCRAELGDGSYEITPLPLASSGDSSGLVGANALLPVPTPPTNLQIGQSVSFIFCP